MAGWVQFWNFQSFRVEGGQSLEVSVLVCENSRSGLSLKSKVCKIDFIVELIFSFNSEFRMANKKSKVASKSKVIKKQPKQSPTTPQCADLIRENAIPAARAPTINLEWNFQQMGIGGLDQEFNAIFRRAFASRALPPDTVEQLGCKQGRFAARSAWNW